VAGASYKSSAQATITTGASSDNSAIESGADYQTLLNDTIVKLKIELTTANIASLNTIAGDYKNVFGLYDNYINRDMTGCPYTAGVGLKDGVYGIYIIEMLDTSGTNFEVRADEEVTFLGNATTYQRELIINDGSVTFILANDAGESQSTLTCTHSGNSCTFKQPGFSMDYVDDVSFFFDNFEAYTGESG